MVAEPEFGSEAGNNMLVRNVFYGSKNSGAEFKAFLAETPDAMGYRTSYTNSDLCLQSAVNPEGLKYYEYILCYVDNMLCISHNLWKLTKR